MKSEARLVAALIAALVAMGCSEKGTGGNGASSSDSSSASGSASSSESADGSSGESGEGDCTYPFPCSPLDPVCSSAGFAIPGCGGELLLGDGDGNNCAVRALRDHIRGGVGISVGTFNPQDESPCGYSDSIRIQGDGTAVLTRDGPGGSPDFIKDRHVQIKPAEHFEPCVDSDDYATIRGCLEEWFVPDVCPEEACCPFPNEAGDPVCE